MKLRQIEVPLPTVAHEYDGRMMHRPRILVSQQGCIPIYRKSFFHRLNALGTIEYVVAHGPAPRGTDLILAPPPFMFPNLPVANHEITIFGISCIWQSIVWKAIKGEFDGAVFGDEVKFLSSLIATVALRLRGRPVLLWGFGFHQYKGPDTLRARITTTLAALYKKMFYRLISGYLAYTEGGKLALRSLPAAPKRVVVLRNTIDTEREAKFRAIVAAEPVATAFCQLGVRPGSVKLLYFGRFLLAKRIDLLVEYAKRSAQGARDVDVIVFGQGPEEERLRAAARNLSNVVFHRHDDLLLARALRISSAVVIPGFLGLAINHSFAHGVPVLSRYGQPHSPEVEYLEDGVNGRLLPEAPEEFFAALDAFVEDRDEQRRFAEGAERTARKIDMDYMVATFHRVVSECLESSGTTLRKAG
jgi:glycosyltransferase involved in cell wall biosynthesis